MQRARVHPAAAAWACFAAAAAVAVAAIGAGAAGTTFAGDEWGLLYRLVDRPLIAVGRLTEVPVYWGEWELPGSSASLGLPRAGLGDEPQALLVYSSRELELCSYRAGAAS